MNEVQARNLTPDEVMGRLDDLFGEMATPVKDMVQKLEWRIEDLNDVVNEECNHCDDYREEIEDLNDEVYRFELLCKEMNAALNNVKALLKSDGLFHETQIEQAVELIEKSQKRWRGQGEWV